MIESSLGVVRVSALSKEFINICKELGEEDPEKKYKQFLEADLYCIFLYFANELGLEYTVETITKLTQDLVKERTNKK